MVKLTKIVNFCLKNWKVLQIQIQKSKVKMESKTVQILHTSHSLWPWKLSRLSLLIATTNPVPGLVGAKVFASIHPLKTHPNPPSPSRLSDRKFLVAFLRSLKLKDLRLLGTDVSALATIKALFKPADGVSWMEEVVSSCPLPLDFVLPKRWKR